MTKKTDSEILNGSSVLTEFNGTEYKWDTQPRKIQRQIRSRLMDIAMQIFDAMGVGDSGKARFSIDGVNSMLDFCEDYHVGMKRDMDRIESYLKSKGAEGFSDIIDGVYMPLFNDWLEPWITGEDDSDTGKK